MTEENLVFPRTWTVTIDGHTLKIVAGTREAAEKIAARRVARMAA